MNLFGWEQEEASSDDYYTPSWVFEQMAVRFDLDVAAPPGGVPWVPADRFFTMADDGLSQLWEGKVWMNPPFSSATVWVDRFVEHGDGVALLPFGNARWLDRVWTAAESVALLPDNMKFTRGTNRESIWWRTGLFGMGEWTREPLERIGHVR